MFSLVAMEERSSAMRKDPVVAFDGAEATPIRSETSKRDVDSWFTQHSSLYKHTLARLHRSAELSLQETETARIICDFLSTHCGSALTVTTGLDALPTAVIAVLGAPVHATKRPILLRADMDALPITGSDSSIERLHDDVHHACGHDGHMACLLSAAHYLSHNMEQVKTKVVFLFQPAEERGGGARICCEKLGLLSTLHGDVESAYALHTWPGLAIGEFAVGDGAMMAESGTFSIDITGTGGHAGMPKPEQSEPLLAACTLVTSAQSLVTRNLSPFDAVSLAFTRIETPTSRALNVIPPHVQLRGTLRTLSPATRATLTAKLSTHAAHIAQAYGCAAATAPRAGYPGTVNTAGGARRARRAALAAGGTCRAVGAAAGQLAPSLAAEDFSYLLQRVGGAYVWLGGDFGSGALHTGALVFDENAVGFGGKWFVWLVLGE